MRRNVLRIAFAMTFALGIGAHSTSAQPLISTYNWTGLYAGGDIGYAWGRSDWVVLNTGIGAPFPTSHNVRGGFGGIHAGFQYQWSRLVLGVEASYMMTGDKGIYGEAVCSPGSGFICSSRVNEWVTVGPRLGFAWNNVLVYGTGGYAKVEVRTRSYSATTGLTNDTTGGWHNGWFAGGGVEWGIARHIVVGVEYKRIDPRSEIQRSQAAFNDRSIDPVIDALSFRLSLKM